MRYTKSFALMLLMSATVASTSFAQSEEEDPLAAIDELNEAIQALEEFEEEQEEDMGAGGDDVLSGYENTAPDSTATLDEVESTVEGTTSEATETVNELQAKSITDRLTLKEIPEGKENHILYTMPGTIDYRGMTFMRIDSSKFFNRFQKCDVAEADTVTSALSRLKISQGAPLECRESMKYQFLPYQTFRATR